MVSNTTLTKRAASITRASERGLGPGNRDLFGPCEMASSQFGECHLGPQKIDPVIPNGTADRCRGSWQNDNIIRDVLFV
jgi:hypothetical protein